MIRKGKEHYSSRYESAMALHGEGMAVGDIARKLGVSYSCAYHWIRGLRKPGEGNPSAFMKFLEENGPAPVLEMKKRFPKHNELFLICSRRGLGVKRARLERKYLEYSTWYCMEGQESLMKKRVEEMISKVEGFRKSLKEAMEKK
ncbi:MAG: helix-turn-helix domain-containing protein [Candidatus Aenigmarchaeota archaeon]|nr:helix-turn-helix domain-containing protein [Candidatus Aenigmarchaeota archaeon]